MLFPSLVIFSVGTGRRAGFTLKEAYRTFQSAFILNTRKLTQCLISIPNALSRAFASQLILWLTENFHHYLYPLGVIHHIFWSQCKHPATAENTAFRFFSLFRLAMRNKGRVSQSPYESTVCFCCCFPSSLCVSQTVAVSARGRGKASFSMAHHSL